MGSKVRIRYSASASDKPESDGTAGRGPTTVIVLDFYCRRHDVSYTNLTGATLAKQLVKKSFWVTVL
jgi:hypothetical protein